MPFVVDLNKHLNGTWHTDDNEVICTIKDLYVHWVDNTMTTIVIEGRESISMHLKQYNQRFLGKVEILQNTQEFKVTWNDGDVWKKSFGKIKRKKKQIKKAKEPPEVRRVSPTQKQVRVAEDVESKLFVEGTSLNCDPFKNLNIKATPRRSSLRHTLPDLPSEKENPLLSPLKNKARIVESFLIDATRNAAENQNEPGSHFTIFDSTKTKIDFYNNTNGQIPPFSHMKRRTCKKKQKDVPKKCNISIIKKKKNNQENNIQSSPQKIINFMDWNPATEEEEGKENLKYSDEESESGGSDESLPPCTDISHEKYETDLSYQELFGYLKRGAVQEKLDNQTHKEDHDINELLICFLKENGVNIRSEKLKYILYLIDTQKKGLMSLVDTLETLSQKDIRKESEIMSLEEKIDVFTDDLNRKQRVIDQKQREIDKLTNLLKFENPQVAHIISDLEIKQKQDIKNEKKYTEELIDEMKFQNEQSSQRARTENELLRETLFHQATATAVRTENATKTEKTNTVVEEGTSSTWGITTEKDGNKQIFKIQEGEVEVILTLNAGEDKQGLELTLNLKNRGSTEVTTTHLLKTVRTTGSM